MDDITVLSPLNDYVAMMFLGGSRRFGYSTENSDYDVFCLATPENRDKMVRDLHLLESRRYKMAGFRQYKGSTFGTMVDINVTTSGAIYKILHKEHEKIEKFFLNYELRDFIGILKRDSPYSGSMLYRALRELLKKEV